MRKGNYWMSIKKFFNFLVVLTKPKSVLKVSYFFVFDAVVYFFVILKFKILKVKYVRVKYHKGNPNWGDDLNVYLIEKMFNRKVVHYPFYFKRHLLGIGSVLSRASKYSVIWGSGFISDVDSIPKISQRNVHVRGELSKNKLEYNNVLTGVKLGDPGLCIRNYFHPKVEKKFKLGVIPHYVDKDHPWIKQVTALESVQLIDIQEDIECFVRNLLACEHVLSSSLHGLIASISYSIPCRHISLSNMVRGGDFKFKDFYTGINSLYQGAFSAKDLENLELSDLIDICQKTTVSDEFITSLVTTLDDFYER